MRPQNAVAHLAAVIVCVSQLASDLVRCRSSFVRGFLFDLWLTAAGKRLEQRHFAPLSMVLLKLNGCLSK
jgi:hypothetical protein